MGYTCLNCGLWVNSGDVHYCAFPPSRQSVFSPVATGYDPLILAELQKITSLLEQLVKDRA